MIFNLGVGILAAVALILGADKIKNKWIAIALSVTAGLILSSTTLGQQILNALTK